MHRTSIEDAATDFLAGLPVAASGPPLAGAVVLSFPLNRDAAAYPVDDANVLDEDVFELGTLAVRLTLRAGARIFTVMKHG